MTFENDLEIYDLGAIWWCIGVKFILISRAIVEETGGKWLVLNYKTSSCKLENTTKATSGTTKAPAP